MYWPGVSHKHNLKAINKLAASPDLKLAKGRKEKGLNKSSVGNLSIKEVC